MVGETPLICDLWVGGEYVMNSGIKILRMRIRDFNNGVQNGYFHDEMTQSKNTTLVIIESLESNKKLWAELMTTYKLKSDKTNQKVISDIDDLITMLSELHMTKADKKAKIMADYKAQMELLEKQKSELLDNL